VRALKPFVDLGVSHIVFLFPYGREVEGLRLMGREVLGKLNND
jgi:hypothetical protein